MNSGNDGVNARVDGLGVFGFAKHLTAGSNPLQFIGNEHRECMLIAAQPRCEDCLIRGLDLVLERLGTNRRTKG
jgi:hypothetical protein